MGVGGPDLISGAHVKEGLEVRDKKSERSEEGNSPLGIEGTAAVPRRGLHGRKLRCPPVANGLSPTTTGFWVLPTLCEPGRGLWTSGEIQTP